MLIPTMLITMLLVGGEPTAKLYPQVADYARQRAAEFDQIAPARRETLRELTRYIVDTRRAGKPVRLTFVCTHNSRRSHLSQVWARVAAEQYGIANVQTYSGGTETTAFNPRAVAALDRAGVRIEKTTDDDNPIYHVSYAENLPPITCFSKVYSQAPNPRKDFCVVMTCDQADKACPIVEGATTRVALPFEDPKKFDGTKEESAKYDERCAQIAREMLFAFSEAKAALAEKP